MGASTDQLDQIADLHRRGLFALPAAVADVGCQQLYGGKAEDVRRFLAHFGHTGVPENRLADFAKNGAFIAYILREAGFSYRSYDIVEAPFCEYFDLNLDEVPAAQRGAFDLVLNFGTTEHVMNQYNALKALHDLAKPGGLIYSFFIQGGYGDHGLLRYSSRFVDLLARANGYETIWEYNHDVPDERGYDRDQCKWIVLKKTADAPFQPVIDVQEGEGLPQLRKRG